MMLKYIGEALGLKVKPRLNETEKQMQDGFVPGMGQIATASYDSLPITVREMIVELKRKGEHDA